MNRTTLKSVIIISDVRRIPGIEEIELMRWLKQFGIPGILILSKADKLSKNEQNRQLDAVARAHSTEREELILFSAKTRMNMEIIWKIIEKAVR